MIRKIIKIDEEKCNGCGACAAACHEGAIGIVNGKAKLLREDYCDGLGDCLPACPVDAISFEEREAPAYDEAAVLASKKQKETPAPCGCPGTHARMIERKAAPVLDGGKAHREVPLSCGCPGSQSRAIERRVTPPAASAVSMESQLRQWPVQIKLAPVNAPYFDGVHLLIAADCTAYAYGNFHQDFIRGKVTLIGCPKLDEGDYTEKLTHIIARNEIRSLTIVRMEVPCCGGIENAAKRALQNSGKFIPWQVVTISTDGRILDR